VSVWVSCLLGLVAGAEAEGGAGSGGSVDVAHADAAGADCNACCRDSEGAITALWKKKTDKQINAS